MSDVAGTPWFSDAAISQQPSPHCLVCYGYGRVIVNHNDGSQPWPADYLSDYSQADYDLDQGPQS